MPEGFTHVTLAKCAAKNAGWVILDQAAFAAGANGPDIFFSFEGWKSAEDRRYDMKGLGNRMHNERTGAFLRALCKQAKTQTQLDYFMGFLAHYAVDTTVHPFVQLVSKKGQLYGKKCGHGYFEIALDSYVCEQYALKRDFGIDEFAPMLTGAALAEVAGQLDRAIEETYGIRVPREYITDAIFDNRRIRSIFRSPIGIKRAIFWLIEPIFGGRGVLTVHVHPRRLRGLSRRAIARGKGLPNPWVDPTTGEEHAETMSQLLTRAIKRTTTLYNTLLSPETARHFWEVLGSYDYVTGTETEASAFDPAKHATTSQVG
ncbi:MAG: zinc dependent phospholipase C family protein [Faecalibacterium sp.]